MQTSTASAFSRLLAVLLLGSLLGCSSTFEKPVEQPADDRSGRFIFWDPENPRTSHQQGVGRPALPTTRRTTAGFEVPADAGREGDMPPLATVATLAYPTGRRETSALLLTKSVPADIRMEHDFTYDIDVENLTNMELQDVVVTDTLGGNLELRSSDPITQSSDEAQARWVLGTMAPGETKSIRVTGRPRGPGVVTTCSSITYNSQVCVSSRVVDPKLELKKSAPAEVLLCDEIPLEFVVSNVGTGTMTDVRIEDTLPEGLTTRDGQQTISLPVGILREGQSRTFTVGVVASRTGSMQNTASATAAMGLEAASNTTTTVVREPVLTLSKKGVPTSYIDQEFTFDITVTNTGDGVAGDTVVTDTLPDNTIFVSATGGGRLVRGAVRWELGALEPKASRNLSLTLRGSEPGAARNVVAAEAYCAKRVTAEAVTEIAGIPAIKLEVVDLTDPVQIGKETIYEITVTNQGSATGTNIKVACAFEAGTEYQATTGATEPVDAAAGSALVTMATLESLAPKKKATWQVRVKAVKAGDIRFKVSVTSDNNQRPIEETEATYIYQ